MTDDGQGRRVLLAGLIDSFGLSLGWTTFVLYAVERDGIGTAAVYNAAMLLGIVIAAPATMWLSRRMSGGTLLTLVGMAELPLRVVTLAALLAGASTQLIAVGVIVMNVAAWTGYAGMRAEVAACEPGSRAMVRYAVGIASIEAVAASIAAALPVAGTSAIATVTMGIVFVLYGGSLAPQFWCAAHARVPAGRSEVATVAGLMDTTGIVASGATANCRPRFGKGIPLMVGGTVIMLIASGPATLNTALAADLYGHLSVIAASVAFSVGCLCATRVTSWMSGLGLSRRTAWTAWAVGMAAGWLGAQWSIAGLLMAQALSGLSLTAFHGEMDAAIAEAVPVARLTASLAWAGALRALGGAIAVRLLPIFVTWVGLVRYVSGILGLLCTALALSTAAVSIRRPVGLLSRPGSARHDPHHRPATILALSDVPASSVESPLARTLN